ncbi:MAG: hypothetical protein KH431_08540 [Erysipelotrichaceae bacterium]|nr:hypothetical protein [Erysipelotrichaceae bacterium]
MQYSSKMKDFPYRSSAICYLMVDHCGKLDEINKNDLVAMKQLYQRLLNQDGELYAVWPQTSPGCLYQVDDLSAFAEAFHLLEPQRHLHEITWSYDDGDDGISTYAVILIQLNCGCRIRFNGLRQFAEEMRNQKGWIIDQDCGMSMSSEEEYTVYKLRVLRSSLHNG